MKERIIVVPNSVDLAKTLAYHGKALFNTRVFTPVELAQESLMRSGKLSRKEFLSRNEELAFYPEIVESTEYFKTGKLSDLKKINSTINTIRELVIADENKEVKEKLSKGQFRDKNSALIKVYEKYISKLNEENKVDTIGLIREAVDNCYTFDSQISYIKEYPLLPLDLELVNKLSAGRYTETSLFDLFGVEEKRIHINSYKNCYGSSNEVGIIIDDILKNKRADESVVACADYNTYSQLFFDYASKYDIPVCFGNGLSIINSYPGKLLEQYYHWMSIGNFGWEPFFKLIYSPYFDFEAFSLPINYKDKQEAENFWKAVSRLRLTNDPEANRATIEDFKHSVSRKDINNNEERSRYLKDIEYVSKELSLPIEEFLNKYTKTRKTNELLIKLDESAKSIINNEIAIIKNVGLDITDDVIETILRKPACRQSAQPGKILIVSVERALTSLRNNLYVCGLSANMYPGSPIENPLLLDGDLEAFDYDKLTSGGKVRQKRETLFDLIQLASTLNNEINLTYAGLNVSELKNNNASSLLFEVFRMENGQDKTLDEFKNIIKQTGYFDPKLSVTRLIGEAYNRSKEILYDPNTTGNSEKTSLLLNKYSPSALNNYFGCKKKFFYQNLLKIDQPDDYNPYEVISASEQGTLAHSLMEYLADHPMSKEEFVKLSGTVFDEYMKISVPLIKEDIETTREDFVGMLSNGWTWDDEFKRKLISKEEDKDCVHKETGICIHGFPDRVELDKNGKAVVIDFKTENKLGKHLKDDVDTCLQVIIYAYIVEQTTEYKVDHCEFRILKFNNGIITCKYDDEIKAQLTEKLAEFKQSLETGDFSIEPFTKTEEKERCKYCKYGSICGKVVTDE